MKLSNFSKNNSDTQLRRNKDHAFEARLFTRRALTAVVLVLLALLTVAGRLAYLQVLNHRHFTTLSDDNRVRIQPLASTRGLIFDRNGILLAENLPSHRLELIPEQIEDLEKTLSHLQLLVNIGEHDITRFRKLLRRNPPYSGVPLRFRLSDGEVARLAVELPHMPGVNILADLSRHYPLGQHAVHIIGYVGRIDERELQRINTSQYRGTSHIGKTGVENSYESLLHGQVGYQQVETNAQGRVLRVLESVPPVPGKNIFLTIDIRLQKLVEQVLAGYNSAAVAIDPRDGAVLALVSEPGYDPNPFVNGIDFASFKILNTSPDRPLFNRALLGAYPPGSTIKPFIGLAGLAYATTTTNRTTYCPGFYRLSGQKRKFRDWRRGGHGRTNLNKGIEQSCDVYFYDLALNLGIDRIHEYLSYYGLGTPTGIDLSGEKSGLLPSRDWKKAVHNQSWYAGETLISGIGQGYMLTTPLQLAHATATLANQGRGFKPRLLYAIQEQGKRDITLEPPRSLEPVNIDLAHWRHITKAMVDVVHSKRGTAKRIAPGLNYTVAGKTGTAQVFSLGEEEKYEADKLAKKLHDHALFIAFAPADDPRIALAVIIEHGGSGGAVAAPLARQILDIYLADQT